MRLSARAQLLSAVMALAANVLLLFVIPCTEEGMESCFASFCVGHACLHANKHTLTATLTACHCALHDSHLLRRVNLKSVRRGIDEPCRHPDIAVYVLLQQKQDGGLEYDVEDRRERGGEEGGDATANALGVSQRFPLFTVFLVLMSDGTTSVSSFVTWVMHGFWRWVSCGVFFRSWQQSTGGWRHRVVGTDAGAGTTMMCRVAPLALLPLPLSLPLLLSLPDPIPAFPITPTIPLHLPVPSSSLRFPYRRCPPVSLPLLSLYSTLSVAGVMLLIACTGFSWGVMQWALFSLSQCARSIAPYVMDTEDITSCHKSSVSRSNSGKAEGFGGQDGMRLEE
ncbi:hypothetical protein C8R45DRAFT_930291 [Mycena sanguinolenta]|nr:hypothetical protein C8R45DRAFT_930291 [Mycena sanguinolenta]